jgi:hypothetical protein
MKRLVVAGLWTLPCMRLKLCMQEPSMKDFLINNEEFTSCDDIGTIIRWLSHTDQLISIAENDADLSKNLNDISVFVSKEGIFILQCV